MTPAESTAGHCCTALQATFGQKALSITSFFTYVGLGLGFLGSNLALPFGLFVLLCQRDPENNVQVSARCQVVVSQHRALHA